MKKIQFVVGVGEAGQPIIHTIYVPANNKTR